jgi:hypothetical protein
LRYIWDNSNRGLSRASGRRLRRSLGGSPYGLTD